MKLTAGETRDCAACGAKMIGAVNGKTGNVAPIVLEPSERGNVLLYRHHATGVATYAVVGDPAAREYLELAWMLEYKSAWYGRTFVKVDRWFPSSKTCSGCGHLVGVMSLSVRSWECPSCGASHDRDVNAAKNILSAGLAAVMPVEGA